MRKTRLCASKRTSQPENVSAEMVMKLPTAYKPEWRLACLIPAPDQKYLRQTDIKKPGQKTGFSIGRNCQLTLGVLRTLTRFTRSEERRVGKEWRLRWSPS